MTTLYIVRHAWAGERDHQKYPDDRLRPLTTEGRDRMRAIVKKLAKRGFAPSRLITSPLVRCRQTADIIAEVIGGKVPIIEREELAPGSDLAGLLASRDAQQPKSAWVGHEPDLGEITARLLGDGSSGIAFSNGAVAGIEFEDHIAQAAGELQWLVTAKTLGV